MKRVFCCALVAVGAFAVAGTASGANQPTADVQNVATVTSQVTVTFEFEVYDCPPGSELVLVDWTANEPARPDSGAVIAGQSYGLSNGAHVQYLVAEAGASSFLPGERWVGSGTIACGGVLISVSGSGQTKSLSGV